MAKHLFYTDAPEAYDWQAWTTTLVEYVGEDNKGKPFRLVEIADDYHAESQTARYGSGSHIALTPDQWEQWTASGICYRKTPEKEIHHISRVWRLPDELNEWPLDRRKCLLKLVRAVDGTPGLSSQPNVPDSRSYTFTAIGPKEQAEKQLDELFQALKNS